ncbi:hypothetical protein [Amycolatopsis sp. DSM 110486]|uniref:hypothetical protein n=1 Tax=Amycolatopsis sp. DSM 110486 TaxID=2865832 RepID=UPI001C69CCA1|nr:hypothetical protein [Amycolatopsis sp. DSM 110486]QYN18967.1 hypothetical protein K1T34_40790 [Amycolatopsis sp. DSM 110486]
MSEPQLPHAARLSELAGGLAAQLGPSMLAEDAPPPDPLTLAAWHAVNTVQRVAELLPDGDLRDAPLMRERSLNDPLAHGESIAAAAREALAAEGFARPGDGQADRTPDPSAASSATPTTTR